MKLRYLAPEVLEQFLALFLVRSDLRRRVRGLTEFERSVSWDKKWAWRWVAHGTLRVHIAEREWIIGPLLKRVGGHLGLTQSRKDAKSQSERGYNSAAVGLPPMLRRMYCPPDGGVAKGREVDSLERGPPSPEAPIKAGEE